MNFKSSILATAHLDFMPSRKETSQWVAFAGATSRPLRSALKPVHVTNVPSGIMAPSAPMGRIVCAETILFAVILT